MYVTLKVSLLVVALPGCAPVQEQLIGNETQQRRYTTQPPPLQILGSPEALKKQKLMGQEWIPLPPIPVISL